MDDAEQRLLAYFKKRVKDILIVSDQAPALYADSTFDFVFVPAGQDPMIWERTVKLGGTLAGAGLPPDSLGAARQGDVWVKCL